MQTIHVFMEVLFRVMEEKIKEESNERTRLRNSGRGGGGT
jgi:hypothetical protein